MEFGDNLKGFVEHVEEYRSYVELKTQMEQIKKNLLVQDFTPSFDAGLHTNLCDTVFLKTAINNKFLTKKVSKVDAKVSHEPWIGISDEEYVQHVKNENPGVIVIDLKPIMENSEEKYDKHKLSGLVEPGEILDEDIVEKQADLIDKKHTYNTHKHDIPTDLAIEFPPCTKCSKTFTTKNNLRTHMHSCHGIGNIFGNI